MPAPLPDMLRGFGGDARGNVAIIFALVLVPVIGIVATAIDYGRASQVQRQMQSALDEALIVARDHIDDDKDAVERLFRTHLDANLPPGLRGLPFDLDLPFGRQRIGASIETKVPTSLMSITGIPTLDVVATNELRRVPRPDAPSANPEGLSALPGPLAGFGKAPSRETAVSAEEAARMVTEQLGANPEELVRRLQQQIDVLQRGGGSGIEASGMPQQLPPEIARMLEQMRR